MNLISFPKNMTQFMFGYSFPHEMHPYFMEIARAERFGISSFLRVRNYLEKIHWSCKDVLIHGPLKERNLFGINSRLLIALGMRK